MQRCLQVLVCGVLLAVTSLAPARQEDLKSGPQPGEMLPGAFHPYNVTGNFPDRPHCLVCEYGLLPVAMVFARELPAPDGPLVKLLQGLDNACVRSKGGELHAFAVFLNDDSQDVDARRPLVKRLRDLAEAAKLQKLVLALDTAEGPKDYKLNKEADVTVVIYAKQKVEANFAFRKDALSDEAIKNVVAAAEKLAPPAPAKKKAR